MLNIRKVGSEIPEMSKWVLNCLEIQWAQVDLEKLYTIF